MKTLQELEEIKNNSYSKLKATGDRIRVAVGAGTCGVAAGAGTVIDKLNELIKNRQLQNIDIEKVGCIGACRLEPMLEVYKDGVHVTYVKINAEKLEKIVDEHLINGNICYEYTVGAEEHNDNAKALEDIEFFKRQTRIALRNCGIINPEKIDEYIACNGYKALEKVLFNMSSEDVINTVKAAGLRGRGGAGFPTGNKWDFAAKAQGDEKYVLCNADEGDPGAFMDRSVLEGDPHSILEAMTIAGFAIGSKQGYIYVRAEYPLAVKRLNMAIEQAHEYGLLGNNIFGTGFSFDIELRLGAGAFVCGEETALMTSIEGKRGEPRPRPPFPANKGLWQKPTILNNVETYANIPEIIMKGSEWFAGFGTEKSKGTKVFALGGKIKNTGLVEIPMGTPLREIIYNIGGGVPNGKKLKAVQTGGPSGGFISEEFIDTPIDYDTLTALGTIMGSGAMVVMDEDNCMVDIAQFFLDFTVDESCGKCPPCRIGTKRMLETLHKITGGKGTKEDLDKLAVLAKNIKIASFCGLGQTAPNPVLSTLRYFMNEYEAHVIDKTCPAHVCKALANIRINKDICKACGICAKNCPSEAISGEKGQPYEINSDKCTKCKTCITKCPFKAIIE